MPYAPRNRPTPYVLVKRHLLTDKQLEVVKHMANGCPNAEIARRMWITESTLKVHIRNILHRLGARDRAHIIAICFTRKIITADDVELPQARPPKNRTAAHRLTPR